MTFSKVEGLIGVYEHTQSNIDGRLANNLSFKTILFKCIQVPAPNYALTSMNDKMTEVQNVGWLKLESSLLKVPRFGGSRLTGTKVQVQS